MTAVEVQRLFEHFVANVQSRGEAAAGADLIAATEQAALSAAILCSLGERLLRGGFSSSSALLLDTAVARFPAGSELRYWRGNALRTTGLDERAEIDLRSVLQQHPEHRDAAYSLAHMLREQGRLNAAADVMAGLWKNTQSSSDDALATITFLIECGAHPTAQAIAEDARTRWPMDARIAARAGEIALALGAFEESATALRTALDLDPGQSAAWLRLAHCQRFSDRSHADIERLLHAWSEVGLAAHSRICVGFALGKALDDLGDRARAVDVLREANALARAATNWRGEDWQRLVESTLRNRPLPTLDVDPDFVPVFIVGLPRTGTTLVARSLAKKRAIRDRGELNWIPALHAHLQTQAQLNDARALNSTARLIRAQMRRDDAPAKYYIDKNPLNFRHLDFIAALFPNAKIINCRRDIRDTALSLWMQHFAHDDLGFAYDFSTIALVDQGYRSLMAHWRNTLALDIADVSYESFVSSPDEELQRLTEWLGLPGLAPSRAAPDSAHDAVTTASVWQVRQPIYTHAVERGRSYAPYLPELVALFPG